MLRLQLAMWRPQVTAIQGTANSGSIVSGGQDGILRVWRGGAPQQSHPLLASLHEHKVGRLRHSVEYRASEEASQPAFSAWVGCVWDLTWSVR